MYISILLILSMTFGCSQDPKEESQNNATSKETDTAIQAAAEEEHENNTPDDDVADQTNDKTKEIVAEVYIESFIASPTNQESITLKNPSSITKDLHGWELCDKNAYSKKTTCKSLSSVVLQPFATIELSNLPFGINDSGEIIYLIDANGRVVGTKGN